MRALVQRVSHAAVSVEDEVTGSEVTGSIDAGLVVFIGVHEDDDSEDASYIVNKTVNLRIFSDDAGRFDLSALDTAADLLVISQFTLYGETRRGRRPSFSQAMHPEPATKLFDLTLQQFEQTGLKVQTGKFQARMLVSLHNDGPVTIMIDSADRQRPRRS